MGPPPAKKPHTGAGPRRRQEAQGSAGQLGSSSLRSPQQQQLPQHLREKVREKYLIPALRSALEELACQAGRGEAPEPGVPPPTVEEVVGLGERVGEVAAAVEGALEEAYGGKKKEYNNLARALWSDLKVGGWLAVGWVVGWGLRRPGEAGGTSIPGW